MKKLILSLVLIPTLIFAQYYSERSTEQNFETSDFYFTQYFFNPFGMSNFKKVTLGLIDNSFLNIALNPSRITEQKERFNFYIDYRGERTYQLGFYDVPMPLLGGDRIIPFVIPDYSITEARTEPEPKFSLGLISAPINSLSDKFFVGATFQRIHRAEKFYQMPYYIYFPRWGYDPYGTKYGTDRDNFPIIDRYSGKDEMFTSANLYSAFTGYKLSDNFSIGFILSGLNHSREGGYRNKYNDDFGNIDDIISQTDYLIERLRNYKQNDYTFGLTYTENSLRFGVNFGYLKGNATQSSLNFNKSLYQNNKPDISPSWSFNMSDYFSNQSWNNSGKFYHGGFDALYKINENIHLIGYFNYLDGKIDFTNSSTITDTNYYYSKNNYNWGNAIYWNREKDAYSLKDFRTGFGTKNKSEYSGLIALRWKLSPKFNVTFGLAYFETKFDITSKEPVIFETIRTSDFTTSNPNYSNRRSYFRTYENKKLEWKYNSVNFAYHIPVILEYKINDKIEFSVLINQITGGNKVNQRTDVFFNSRIRTENDSTKQFSNFIERYLNPSEHSTFEKTDIIGNFKVNLDQNLSFRFLIDPEVVPFIRIAQFWFSIEGRL
ncbi:MAG: hypothetical protein N3F03_00200 [Ignavibacteria bacterium]|nr:hypothetical protein [Ignavibacteria bacterium]